MCAVPHIFLDRSNLTALEADQPDLVQGLKQLLIGKTDSRETVHFCGLAWVDQDSACMFIPRQSLTADETRNREIAKLTMQTLSRYGREMAERSGIAPLAEGQTGLLATIKELASDFLQYGIYSERMRYHTRDSGKPSWLRTVIREQAFVDPNGSVVYPNIRTTRSIDSHDTLLARVQVAILIEIASIHGWWLDGLTGREEKLKQYAPPNITRFLWARYLKLLLPQLYAVRALNLANLLIAYLEDSRGRRPGKFLFGVEDFHTIWEHMLRSILSGVDPGWNKRLPRPAYIRRSGEIDIQERGMQTDIVLRDGNMLRIADAKYYDAIGIGSTPAWPDIVKQFFYDLAVRSVVEEEEVSGCFVFPSLEDNVGVYSKIEMRHRDLSSVSDFPAIECHYLSIAEVMRAYVAGKNIAL